MGKNEKIYIVKVALTSKDFFAKTGKHLEFAMTGKRTPNKDDVRDVLTAIIDQELIFQNIPKEGKRDSQQSKAYQEILTNYVDLPDQVNQTHYTVKEWR